MPNYMLTRIDGTSRQPQRAISNTGGSANNPFPIRPAMICRHQRLLLLLKIGLAVLALLLLAKWFSVLDGWQYGYSFEYVWKSAASDAGTRLKWINGTNGTEFSVRFKNLRVPYAFGIPSNGECPPNTKLLLLVGSSRAALDARTAIRSTWAKDAMEHTALRFFVGDEASGTTVGGAEEELEGLLRAESGKHGDLIRIAGIEDNYHNLFLKLYAAMEWKVRFCGSAQWVLKTDDDTVVHLARLGHWIEHKFHAQLAKNPATIFGCLNTGNRPFRDKGSKWYVSIEEYPLNQYPNFVSGPSYLASADAISVILRHAGEVNAFRLEDVLFTGIVAQRANVSRVDASHHFHPYKTISTGCEGCVPRLTAVHLWNVREQLKFEQQYSTLRAMNCPAPECNKKTLILGWNEFFGRPLMQSLIQGNKWSDERVSSNVSVCANKCEYSDDKHRLADASVVVFHMWESVHPLPAFRRPDQLFTFFFLESPLNSYGTVDTVPANFFNVTMSYRMDSDIPFPYDQLETLGTGGEEISEEELRRKVANKTRLALQIVSNCKASSGRALLVEQLKKHMQVDLFGSCSERRCDGNCFDQQMDSHFFYLAFENSVCLHYVSEKFWNMKRLIVPVVLTRSVFDGMDVPPGSFIAADEFESAHALASHLQILANDTEMYLSHFEWTKRYKLTRQVDGPQNPLCRLCDLASHRAQKRRVVNDIGHFWRDQAKCQNAFVNKSLFSQWRNK